jgi:UDP-N-acetylmuramate dehydrogenase
VSDPRPSPDAGAVARAASILRETCGDRLRTDVAMAPLTTFRIGGPAALFLEPESRADLDAVGRAVRATGIAVVVIGRGSNVLVADDGFRGLALRLGKGFRWTRRDGTRVSAGGAMPLPALAGLAAAHGLSGLEFGVAIPATVGGAVRMNAGAHHRQMADVVREIDVFDVRGGRFVSVPAARAGFGYRTTSLGGGSVVVGVLLGLTRAEPAQIRARMDEAREWRRRTQPLAEPNCGSVFKNPAGAHAAQLVEAAGAKGLRIGGAAVSVKHANFIVTRPGATANDVIGLIRRVQARVAEHAGVDLETEVQLVGGIDLDA